MRVGTNSTVALLTARFTDALTTPGSARRAFSTRRTQDAQDIPWIDNSAEAVATSYPVSRTADMRTSGVTKRGSARTVACPVAKLTFAEDTPGKALSPRSTFAAHAAQCIPAIGKSMRRGPAADGMSAAPFSPDPSCSGRRD